MKALLNIFICIACIISLSGCFFEKVNKTQQSPIYFGKDNIHFEDFEDFEIQDKGNHYVVYRYDQDEPFNKYFWFNIFDNNRNIVLNGGTEWKEPEITEVDNIVSVTLNFGTLANISRYYDTQNNILSDEYNNVLAQNGSLICFFDKSSIIITNAFDNDEFYKEIKKNFSDTAFPIEQIDFSSSEFVTISYYSKPKNELITEKIYLKNQGTVSVKH